MEIKETLIKLLKVKIEQPLKQKGVEPPKEIKIKWTPKKGMLLFLDDDDKPDEFSGLQASTIKLLLLSKAEKEIAKEEKQKVKLQAAETTINLLTSNINVSIAYEINNEIKFKHYNF